MVTIGNQYNLEYEYAHLRFTRTLPQASTLSIIRLTYLKLLKLMNLCYERNINDVISAGVTHGKVTRESSGFADILLVSMASFIFLLLEKNKIFFLCF